MGETLRVSGKSRPNAVAGAIAALVRTEGWLEVQAIGPAAVNQTVKALAIARGYLVEDGLDLSAQPAFVKLEMEDEERTAVRFLVRREQLQASAQPDPIAANALSLIVPG
jgi:stage V sporulation protein S